MVDGLMKFFNNSKSKLESPLQIFARLGEKLRRWEFLTKFLNLYTKFSMEKLTFSPFSITFFQDLCHFIRLWKITPFFYHNFSVWVGGIFNPIPLCGTPANSLLDLQTFLAFYILSIS